MKASRRWLSIALAISAGAIGYSGHDGWGWCLFLVFLNEVHW